MFRDEMDWLVAKLQSPMSSGNESSSSERTDSLLLGSRVRLDTANDEPIDPADLLLPFDGTVQSVLESCLDSSILANRLRRMEALFLVFLLTSEAKISSGLLVSLALLGLPLPVAAVGAVGVERFGLLDGLEGTK